jgi:plastocyanin
VRATVTMKLLGLMLLVLGLAVAASPALAQGGGSTSFTLKGHTDGASNYWTQGDATDKNPTLEVPANTAITLTVSAASGAHTIKVGGKDASNVFSQGDAAITYSFTSPATGNVDYVCTIHSTDMKGQFHVAGTASTEPEKKSPSLQVVGVSLALLGAALLVRRK